jgi:lysophospholipase L1-like esterase
MNPIYKFRFLMILFLLVQLIFAQQELQKNDSSKIQPYPFEKEIKAFKKTDSTAMPPQDAILFIGSSSIRMWKTLNEDMSPLKVINRGFGGSEMEHAIHYFDQIVEPYRPHAIVLYEGDNDIAAGKSPDTVFADFKIFAELAKSTLPGVPLFFISIKPSISREKFLAQMQQANNLIKEYCDREEGLFFIDVAASMMDKDKIKTDIFIEDNLHMNTKGYDIWEKIVKAQLVNHLF